MAQNIDVAVTGNGSTKINVYEGEVAMKSIFLKWISIRETILKKSKALSAIKDSIDSKEIIIERVIPSEMPKKLLKQKFLKKVV